MSDESVLWAAVIEQAFADALCRVDSPNDVLSARRWLLFDRKDFYLVCEFAEIAASAVRRKAQQLANNNWSERAVA